MNEQGAVATRADMAQFIYNPLLIAVEPERFAMTAYQSKSLADILANRFNVGVSSIVPIQRVGCIWTVNVTPAQRSDPPLIISINPTLDLSAYYSMWLSVEDRLQWRDAFISEFSNMGRAIGATVRGLNRDELGFLVLELLAFKNRVLSNRIYSDFSLAGAG